MIKVKWIFFDVGTTLVNERDAYDSRVRDMIEGTGVTFEEFDKKRIEFAKEGKEGHSSAIRFFGLSKTPWHGEKEIPFDQSAGVLKYLKDKGYKLGVIANQKKGLSDRLDRWGLLQYFDVVASSSDLGMSKPKKAIFYKAFEMAGCQPEEAAMVGDRVDNDILPAKALGMSTVWVKQGLAVYQDDALADGKADSIVNGIEDIKKVF